MTIEQVIDDVFRKEGDRYAEPPEIDQPTGAGGIILPTLSEYLGRPATLAELKALAVDTARPIVRWKLSQLANRAGLDRITFEPLRLQAIDMAYNSGEGLAIRWLQRVLRVARSSKMDAPTIAALTNADQWLVNQALIGARLQMIDMSTNPGGSVDKKFEEGLENRALTFSLLEVP